ncbi:MAG: MarR family transcriptional regulator [Actinomycetota bacterium]|nr:MarR family transcriptional regulator [Actinomycetota bacterium]
MAVPSGPVAPSTEAESALFELVDSYDRAYETAATTQALSGAQACVLGRLDAPRGMGSLAQELGCDASNITQIVARLERRGLVTRQPDPSDRRGRLISRTPAGDDVNAQFEQAFEFGRDAVQRLSRAEQDQLTALVRKALGD